jgi:hypothetical protein
MGALSDGARNRKNKDSAVRRVQKDENNRFKDACHDHGADGETITKASGRVNRRIFPVTPSGPLDKWDEEDQKKQAIAKRRATQRVKESDPQTSRDIIDAAGDGAAQARREINDHGVAPMWEWLLGKRGEKPIVVDIPDDEPDDGEPEFLTRAEQIRREEAQRKKDLQQQTDPPPIDPTAETKSDDDSFKFFIFF